MLPLYSPVPLSFSTLYSLAILNISSLLTLSQKTMAAPSPSEEEEDTTHDEYHHRMFDYEELATATGGFSPSNLIGRGSHGSVYKAFLHRPDQVVAVKRSSSGHHKHIAHENSCKLENEIRILSSLQERRQSPSYIINFLGANRGCCSLQKAERLLVMEYLPNGSLEDLLHDKEVALITPSRSCPSWAQRVEIVVQLARAVEFLHEGCKPLCIVHRDLKPSNILFDSSWKLKLADFGLAVSVSRHSESTNQPAAGTIGYMDPCYTTSNKLTTKVDVYSFGVVVLEIVSGRKAIDVARSPSSIVDWATGLIREQRTMEICNVAAGLPEYFMAGTVEKLLYVAARCVSPKPDDRPTMGEVVAGLVGFCGPVVRRPDRVRLLPGWMDLVRRKLKRVRKKRKLAESVKKGQVVVKCAARKEGDDGGQSQSKGKLLLWELLADITLT